MGDVKFLCSHCQQPMVVDGIAAGAVVKCPGCSESVQVPGRANANEELLRAAVKELGQLRQHLLIRTEQVERLTAERVAFEEALNAHSAECSSLADNVHRLEQENEALHAHLEAQHENLAALATDRNALEAQVLGLDDRAEAAELELAASRGEILSMRPALERLEEQSLSHQHEIVELSATLDRAMGDLRETREQLVAKAHALQAAETRVEKLRADLQLKPELASFVALKDEGDAAVVRRERLEGDLREARQDLEMMRRERDQFRRQTVERELKIAALRAEAADSRLEQDNQVLRDLVERLNEELRERGPAARPRRMSGQVFPSMSEVKRWVASHAYVPEES